MSFLISLMSSSFSVGGIPIIHICTYVKKISWPSFYFQTHYDYCSYSFFSVHILFLFIICSRLSLSLSFSGSAQMLYRNYYGNKSPIYYLFLYDVKRIKEKKKRRRLHHHCRPCIHTDINPYRFEKG
jgi:hypothetical protein